jgi:hypothetical protein
MIGLRAHKCAVLVVFVVAPSLVLLGPACVEDVTIGGDERARSADASETGTAGDAECSEGQSLQMGVCVSPSVPCSMSHLDGGCPDGQTCTMGACITPLPPCSAASPNGTCPMGETCEMGTCIGSTSCMPMAPDGGGCPQGELCTPLGTCQTNPCLMSLCMELLCCPTFEMMAFVAACSTGTTCP